MRLEIRTHELVPRTDGTQLNDDADREYETFERHGMPTTECVCETECCQLSEGLKD